MPNPTAPQEGGGRRIPFLGDPDNPANAYLAVGIGAIDMGVGVTPGAAQAVTPWGVGSNGVVRRPYVADTFKPFDLTAVTTEQTIWDPAAGKKFRLLGFTIRASATSELQLIDGTGGSTIFRIGVVVNVPVTIDLGATGIVSGADDRNLMVVSGTSADLYGTAWGVEED